MKDKIKLFFKDNNFDILLEWYEYLAIAYKGSYDNKQIRKIAIKDIQREYIKVDYVREEMIELKIFKLPKALKDEK